VPVVLHGLVPLEILKRELNARAQDPRTLKPVKPVVLLVAVVLHGIARPETIEWELNAQDQDHRTLKPAKLARVPPLGHAPLGRNELGALALAHRLLILKAAPFATLVLLIIVGRVLIEVEPHARAIHSWIHKLAQFALEAFLGVVVLGLSAVERHVPGRQETLKIVKFAARVEQITSVLGTK